MPGAVGQGRVEQLRAVAAAVVGEDLFYGAAVGGEEGRGPAEEPGRGDGAFVGQGLGEREPGVGVDGGVPVAVADPFPAGGAVLGAAAAVDPPPAAGRDGADLLDVQVDQLTWAFGDGPADLAVAVAGDVEVPEPADPEPAQPPVHGRRGHLDPVGGEFLHDQAGREFPVPAQRLDPRHHHRVGPGGPAGGPRPGPGQPDDDGLTSDLTPPGRTRTSSGQRAPAAPP